MIVIADTSGLLASVDIDDSEHEASRRAIAQAGLLVISPMVLAELDYLVARHLGEDTANDICDHVAKRAYKGDYEIARVDADMLAESKTIRARYRALELGLTDAVNVVLAARYKTDAILTLDRRHFRAVRPVASPQRVFRLLPNDLDG